MRELLSAAWVRREVSDIGSGGYTTSQGTMKETTKEEEYMGLGNLGDLGNLDVGQLTQYIPNVNFPASKEEVLSDAQNNDAPQEVVDGIRNSGKDTFNSADEVLQAVQGRL
jgi:hypothetical protein